MSGYGMQSATEPRLLEQSLVDLKFSGGGTDLRGQDFHVDDLNSVDLVLRILEREGFLNLPQDPDGEQD